MTDESLAVTAIHVEQQNVDTGWVSEIEQEKDRGWAEPDEQNDIDPEKVGQIEKEKGKGRSSGSSSSW